MRFLDTTDLSEEQVASTSEKHEKSRIRKSKSQGQLVKKEKKHVGSGSQSPQKRGASETTKPPIMESPQLRKEAKLRSKSNLQLPADDARIESGSHATLTSVKSDVN